MNYTSLTAWRLGTFWRKDAGIKEEDLKSLWQNSSLGMKKKKHSWLAGSFTFPVSSWDFIFEKRNRDSKMFQMVWLEPLVKAFHSE